jgi:hypothetical protein
VSERIEKGSDFKDSRGRKAIKYLTYLKKEKKSVEEAKEIAEKEGWFLPEIEISEKKVEKDKRGRPKKEAKEVSAEKVVDLFAGMVAEVSSGSCSDSGSESDTDMLSEMMGNMSVVDEEKEGKKKKSEEKVKKEQEKALEKAKKAEEKAKKEQEKAKKEEEKAKKAAEKEKKALKSKKGEEKAKKGEEKAKSVAVEPEKVKLTVTKFTHEGKEYFKTANGLLYDPKTKEEVGMYCEATKSIKALPDDSDSELEEEEYEEDD